MNFHTEQQRADFLAAQNRIVRDLTKMHLAQYDDHKNVGRQLADIANALQILTLIWNEVADDQK